MINFARWSLIEFELLFAQFVDEAIDIGFVFVYSNGPTFKLDIHATFSNICFNVTPFPVW